jgi:predicted nucleic acid-binding protein
VSFLLDTNIVSELRRGDAANASVLEWFDHQPASALFLSVITVGEIRQGIEQLRPKRSVDAAALDRWLDALIEFYEDRLLYVDGEVADEWGRLQARRPGHTIDGLLAATARVHKLTVVTRNVRDFSGLPVKVLNPFSLS